MNVKRCCQSVIRRGIKTAVTLCWSIKYEEVYIHAYKSVFEALAGIGRYLSFDNS
jgi:hypothetical protein